MPQVESLVFGVCSGLLAKNFTSGYIFGVMTDDDRRTVRGGGLGAPAISGAAFAGLGLQFALAILFFLYVGKWLDAKLGTEPWLLVLGVFVGAGGGFYSIYRKLMGAQRQGADRR